MRLWENSASRVIWFIILLIGSAAVSPTRAHDVEPAPGAPPNIPAESHVECVDGLAGSYPCSNIELVGFVPAVEFGGFRINDIWGWTDSESGIEYAIIGTTGGTAFFELNSHGHPIFLGTLPKATFFSTWRDMKVYDDFVFVVSEASGHGMQVFDLTRLRDHEGPPETFASDAHYTRFGSAHNIAINEDTAFAYAVGTNTCSGGLHMVDISDPLAPRFAGCYSGDGYTHDTQCVTYHGPDDEFVGREICLNSNEDTVTIVDVTIKSAPVQLSRSPYLSSRYVHQGWLTENHQYFFLDDELDERNLGINTRTLIWDVGDLRAPRITGVHLANSTAIDHNQYVVGNHLFQANYRAGIRILRIGDLSVGEVSEIAYFDTSPVDDNAIFLGTWSVYPFFESGLIIASDIRKGLFVLRPDLTAVSECSDGVDNDGDGLRDYAEDPTCVSPEHASERIRLDIEIDFGADFDESRIESPSHGEIHMSILGSATLDVSGIDLGSLRLGPLAASPSGPNEYAQTTGQSSFDDDDFDDRVIKFRMDEIGLSSEDSEICLEGLIGEEVFRSCYSLAHREDQHEDHEGDEPDHESAGFGSAPGAGVSSAGGATSVGVAVPSLGFGGSALLVVQFIVGFLWTRRLRSDSRE
jgi:choice-of-anchor B domain-containing protein